jgi:hypothetical protein
LAASRPPRRLVFRRHLGGTALQDHRPPLREPSRAPFKGRGEANGLVRLSAGRPIPARFAR